MKKHTNIWPVEGVCDLCPFYVTGSLEKEDLKIGEHCRFKVLKKTYPACEAEIRNPELEDV